MSVLDVLFAARDLGRLQEIASTFARHGLGDVVQRMGLSGPLERAGRALHWSGADQLREMPTHERVRRALEQLGPTFVKFGQLLATRPDLLSPDWITEFERLHQAVTPVPFAELLPQLEEDLGADPRELFEGFDETPLAAGSIGQVHSARLSDGRRVVLKIRRPGIRAKVEADLRLLERFAELTEQELPELRRYRPVQMVRLFSRTLREELDLSLEARNTELIGRNLADDEFVEVPEVIDEFTRERLLVLAFVDGVSAGEWAHEHEPGTGEGPLLAARGADAILKMIFVDGIYHADPHPGNVFFQPQARLVLLDCGMVGRLSERRREEFMNLLVAVFKRDERRVVAVLLDWAGDEEEVDTELLAQDARAFIDRYHGAKLGDVDLQAVLGDVVDMVRENGLILPADMSSLIRVFALLDNLGRELDPDFDLTSKIQPMAERAIREQHSLLNVLGRQTEDLAGLVRELPRDLRQLFDKARRGKLRLEVRVNRLPEFGDRITESANRVTVGMITAALIVGTSIAMTVDKGPMLLGIPVLGLLGFLTSCAVGAGLLWSILRSGRR
ncbi:AarF/UbiB family protein [Engelhardtia mirabilis]